MRHAPTQATRRSGLPLDEPLDELGHAAAAAAQMTLPAGAAVLCSPALRCRETAMALGLEVVTEDRGLAECDFGRWGGRTLAEIAVDESAAVAAWISDPDARPHDGESLTDFALRVAGWLDAQASLAGCAAVVTHGGVIKAAVTLVLRAPLAAFWQIGCAPLGLTELRADDGHWSLVRHNAPLAARVLSEAAR